MPGCRPSGVIVRKATPTLVVAAASAGLPLAGGVLGLQSACTHRAQCEGDDFYTFAASPGEAEGSYRGLPFGAVTEVAIAANSEGSSGSLDISGTGPSGDDDDSAGGDDDDSAGNSREYEGITAIDSWALAMQFQDTRGAGNTSVDGLYTLRPDNSGDCTTFGDKCFDLWMRLNGSDADETWNGGRLEIFPLDEGLRGCLYVADSDGDAEAFVNLYFND
jgi:hypothetical protein